MKAYASLALIAVAILAQRGSSADLESYAVSLPARPLVVAYDQALCIQSCDAQYSACTSKKPQDPDWIQYCSGQHDSCRAACLERS